MLIILSVIFLLNFGLMSVGIIEYQSREIKKSEAIRASADPNIGLGGGVREHRTLGHVSERSLFHACEFILLCFFVILFFLTLGSGTQDLGQVGWTLEWLFTFPVPARGLFLAKVSEYAAGNLFGWIVFLPFLFVIYWRFGLGAGAFVLAPLATILVLFAFGSVHLVAETWLRKRFSRDRLKNIQALCTVAGMGAMIGLSWMLATPGGSSSLVEISGFLGSSMAWIPPCLSVRVSFGGMDTLISLGALLGCGLVFCLGAVAAAEGLVRDGLVTEAGAFQGRRGRAAGERTARDSRLRRSHPQPSGRRNHWFKGIVAKELRLLMRDRNFLVQTLFIPIAVVLFQIIANPQMFKAGASDFNHAAMIAFGIGTYSLMFSAIRVLSFEGKAFWLLFTFPEEIDGILFRKVILWGLFALIFPLPMLGWSIAHLESVDFHIVLNVFMVIAGIFIYSVVAAGVGILGTDLMEEQLSRRVSPARIYLFALLAALYSYAIYTPIMWHKAGMLVLCSLLAAAIWQKVRDQVPYMLDPVAVPPPRLALSDGLIAALVFFVIQGIASLLLMESLGAGPAVVVAYGIAGAIVTLLSLFIFTMREVPNLAEAVGFCLPRREAQKGVAKLLASGAGWGIASFSLCFCYLWLVERVGPSIDLKNDLPRMAEVRDAGRMGFAILAVVLAPLFEEYIFRGLIYKGMRRTVAPLFAIPASAAVFAVVHPPITVIPAFILGLFAAYSFERSRLLLTPIIIHVIHNACVTLISF